ncbi:MAG: nitrite/sulfite reductase [Hyphomicrobiaceae bacterium]|nr:nitrite/sulfite reductase [Hyphomicrobiaceae bacterium]
MYRYDSYDHAFVRSRASQFRDQVRRRLTGELSEEQFRPLRLHNGLYLQLHAYMLRVAIPYGVLSSSQLRTLADIARQYDRGFGHFTTRQNIQFNWIKLEDAPDILDALAAADMHAVQTSGNCIRNVTADPYAGVAADEIEDPRVWAEVLRQWSSVHPEFLFLPRKFKIAISGALEDRAAVLFHDIGLRIVKGRDGRSGFAVHVGGGQGRTPYVAQELRGFLPREHLLSYLEAVMRVYNLHGRRDNIYKARIKILVNAIGIDEFRRQVEAEWSGIDKPQIDLPEAEYARIAAHFAPKKFARRPVAAAAVARRRATDAAFDRFYRNNTAAHRTPGYRTVTIALKEPGLIPGDMTADQMDAVADLARRHSGDELRITYTQNIVLPTVAIDDLATVYDGLVAAGLASANAGLLTDIIACPGLDYCNLANARSIPLAQAIAARFAAPERVEDIGELRLNISGCINACGHHHAGNIGILGVDKKGTEHYQITLGGSPGDDADIGAIVGPSFPAEDVPGAIETLVETYLALRQGPSETFLAAYRRLGLAPFKAALYAGTSNTGTTDEARAPQLTAAGV